MEKKSYVLASNGFCYTPGVVRWARALRKRDIKGARSDTDACKRMLRGLFPDLPPAALLALAEGRYVVDKTAETITVEA